jgi:hypothetical protein
MNLELFHRYKVFITRTIHYVRSIVPILENYGKSAKVIGKSVLGNILFLSNREGKTKIFLWSQMHGNEATTTKALFDF